MGRHNLEEEQLPHPLDQTTRRYEGRAENTGSHRIVGKTAPRRRVAKWPIVIVAVVAVVALGVFGWNWLDGVMNSRAEAEAVSCTQGNANIRVLVSPAIEKPASAAALKWNQAKTVVYSHCIHVDIQAVESSKVLDALLGRAQLDTVGGLPSAWIPESSLWIGELQTAKPEMISAPPLSVASAISADYPFLGLAGTTIDDTQMRAAQAFRDYLKQPTQQAEFVKDGIRAT